MIYDYAFVDPVPLARVCSKLTRCGDVASLPRTDDDRSCIVGPRDEARLEFDAEDLTPLPSGWNRSYVLRDNCSCKDADPFTLTSDTVEPLPWRALPAFPVPAGSTRLTSATHESYLREYQTRLAGPGKEAFPPAHCGPRLLGWWT